MRVVNTGPRIAACRSQVGILLVRRRDLKAESELVAPGTGTHRKGTREIWKCGRLSLHNDIADLIGGHCLNAVLAQYGLALRFTAVEKHLQKLDVVRRSGIQTSVAGNRRRDRRGVWCLNESTRTAVLYRHNPVGLSRGNSVGRVH